MKKKVRKARPILHSITVFFTVLLLIATIVANILLPTFQPMIDVFLSNGEEDTSDDIKTKTKQEAIALSVTVQEESTVLLRNEGGTLPLSGPGKINVFGWASSAWLGGGSGSGGVSSVEVDLIQALTDAGFTCNSSLTDYYVQFHEGRDYTSTLNSWPEQSCILYEPDISTYPDGLLEQAEDFSDTAIVVIGRLAGESNDCTLQQYKYTADGVVVDKNRTYLDLSTEELNLLHYVGESYDKVIILLNTGNVMALGEIEIIPGIDSCLMVGYTGQYGASAISGILTGEVNPSGRTADTWAYDFSTAASFANSAAEGVGAYTNGEGLYPFNGTINGNLGESFSYDQVSYLDYAEGIYVGYKWYETADAEGIWDNVSNIYGGGYAGIVQYPFGYGLSYTEFEWEIVEISELSVTVRVTNIGNTAGKDVVQLYYTAPYYSGQIEKSVVELAAFEKTSLLQPGESQEVTLSIELYDMASYDDYDSNQNGFTGYELDAGEYILSIRRNAHSIEGEFLYTLEKGIQYTTDPVTGLEVNNKFTGETAIDGVSLDGTDAQQNIIYMTRADFTGTFPYENVDSRKLSDNAAALNLFTEEMANAWISENDAPVTTGADNGLKIEENGVLTELGVQLGTNYGDPAWGDVLDQITPEEMMSLVMRGYSHTAAVDSIGKSTTKDADGPAQIGGFVGRNPGVGFSNSATLAQSWNPELALDVGRMIGKQAAQKGYSGWYAPAVNLHRSPFNGRNYEYYSEDSLLSGIMCGNTVAGAKDSGIYCYVKHFICNDGEAGIYRDSIYIWMREQTLREVYLEPFRIIVEEYGATGIMSAYNRIGAVWAGGSMALLTGVLRNEWNFKGAVITDYSDHHEYMSGDHMIRAGGDLWMDGVLPGSLVYETTSNTFQNAMRRASKNIIYMYLNARVENLNYVKETGTDTVVAPESKAEAPNLQGIFIAVAIMTFILLLLSVHALILDIQTIRKRKHIQH